MSQFIAIQNPPGQAIAAYDRQIPVLEQKDIPPTFADAMGVREEVFVKQQNVPLENELDEDDARSWHWVGYASVGAAPNTNPEGKRGSTAQRLAVATVRLVPPPHPPHPTPGSEHQIDNSEVPESKLPDLPGRKASQDGSTTAATTTTTHVQSSINPKDEPYIKIGRIATLTPYRKLGLAKLLLDTALDWASKHPFDILPLPSATSREAARAEGQEANMEMEVWNGLVLVHSQKHLEGLYGKWGFSKDEKMGEWDEEGIPHVGMWRRIEVDAKAKAP